MTKELYDLINKYTEIGFLFIGSICFTLIIFLIMMGFYLLFKNYNKDKKINMNLIYKIIKYFTFIIFISMYIIFLNKENLDIYKGIDEIKNKIKIDYIEYKNNINFKNLDNTIKELLNDNKITYFESKIIYDEFYDIINDLEAIKQINEIQKIEDNKAKLKK